MLRWIFLSTTVCRCTTDMLGAGTGTTQACLVRIHTTLCWRVHSVTPFAPVPLFFFFLGRRPSSFCPSIFYPPKTKPKNSFRRARSPGPETARGRHTSPIVAAAAQRRGRLRRLSAAVIPPDNFRLVALSAICILSRLAGRGGRHACMQNLNFELRCQHRSAWCSTSYVLFRTSSWSYSSSTVHSVQLNGDGNNDATAAAPCIPCKTVMTKGAVQKEAPIEWTNLLKRKGRCPHTFRG